MTYIYKGAYTYTYIHAYIRTGCPMFSVQMNVYEWMPVSTLEAIPRKKRRGALISTDKNITRASLISTGKNMARGGSHKHWEYSKSFRAWVVRPSSGTTWSVWHTIDVYIRTYIHTY